MARELKPRTTKRILLFVAFGLLVLAFYLYYFAGTANIVEVIKHTNLAYYASAFIAFTISVLFSTLAWQSLLQSLAVKTKMRRMLLLTWAGMFFDATVPEPGWTGDLSKAYMLAKTSNQDAGKIAASVIGQKVIVMAVTVIDLLIGFSLLTWNYALHPTVLIFVTIVLILTTSFLLIAVYISTKPEATKRILNWLIRAISFLRRGHWNPHSFRAKAEDMLNKFHEGIRVLGSNPKSLVRPVIFAFIAWAFDVSIVFLVFASLGYPVPVDKVLIVYAITGSLQTVGVSIVGFTEIIVTSSYTVLGIPIAISISVTILTRIITLWFKMITSYIAFQ